MMQSDYEMKVIGITGGVGSGKSALLKAITEKYNCVILLADDIANWLKEPGQEAYEPLIQLMGKQILAEDGHIDKQKMADLIFKDTALLQQINDMIHPMVEKHIRQRICEEREKNSLDFVFVEAALFIEAGYRDMVDSLWYIYADMDVRIKRLTESRGYSLSKIHSIMNKQLQEEEFRSACDVVIDNSGSVEAAMEQAARYLEIHEIM